MASAHAFHSVQRTAQAKAFHTPTMLNRWSCTDKTLPPANDIGEIHVYDFDNTLFNSPTPNPAIWDSRTIGAFQSPEFVTSGGWWHDCRILAATGEGVEIESKRSWAGCWNEKVVELIQLSMAQPDAVTVLLTGRQEKGFAELIKKMVHSKGLDFDLIVLKPEMSPQGEKIGLDMNTIVYKNKFLTDLMETYKYAQEIKIYEDRSKHVDKFREFFVEYNRKQKGIGGMPTRGPITAEVILVTEGAALLDPVVEIAEIQRLLNDHNKTLGEAKKNNHKKIVKSVLLTGYMISAADSAKIRSFVSAQEGVKIQELKWLADNIMICPGVASKTVLEKAGGMGTKVLWQGIAGGSIHLGKDSVYAVKVQPVPPGTEVHTYHSTPFVVLATQGKNAKPYNAQNIQQWQPLAPEDQYIFEAVVGEKAVLRVEEEGAREAYEREQQNRVFKRKDHDFDSVPTGPGKGNFRGGRGNARGGYPSGPRNQNARGRGGFADRGGGHRGGKHRGGKPAYVSLDEMKDDGGGGIQYEDEYPTQPATYHKRQNNNDGRYEQRGYDSQGGGFRGGGGGRGRGRGGGGGGGGAMGGYGTGNNNVGDFY